MNSDPLSRASSPRLRPATPGDFDAVRALLQRADLPTADVESQFGPQYVVAEAGDGNIVGVAGVEIHGRFGLLRSVAVAPELRSAGLGIRLSEDRIQWAKAARLESLYLLTTTASGYWPRFGFERIERDEAPEPITRSAEWSHLCPSSSVAMRKVL